MYTAKTIIKLNTGGIYVIHNIISGKDYIGSAVNFSRRWGEHLGKCRRNKHSNSHLRNSYNKHGSNVFTFNILEVVEDKTKLIEREQFWIDSWKPEYNIRKTAGSNLNTEIGLEKRFELSTSEYLGVTFYKNANYENSKKWQSRIRLKGKQYHLGVFDTAKKAHEHYLEVYNLYLQTGELPESTKPKQKFKGYYFVKSRNRYRVIFTINNKKQRFGEFKSEQEAIDRVEEVRALI